MLASGLRPGKEDPTGVSKLFFKKKKYTQDRFKHQVVYHNFIS